MTHPGMDAESLEKTFSWQYHWEDELQAFLSEKNKCLLEQKKVTLINFGGLWYAQKIDPQVAMDVCFCYCYFCGSYLFYIWYKSVRISDDVWTVVYCCGLWHLGIGIGFWWFAADDLGCCDWWKANYQTSGERCSKPVSYTHLMGEVVGQFFKQFGLTVAFALAFSTMAAYTPVSYTHLDVYKRQEVNEASIL